MQPLDIVHLLLNLVGLLLWLRWREEMLQSSRRSGGLTLLGTLKRTASSSGRRWSWLALLAGLVGLRALGYWQIGSAVRWTPSLDLGALVISFRSDLFGRILIFSVCSQLAFVACFYFWLLLLSAVNRRLSDTDPFQNRIRAHLGWVDRWPAALKLLLPFLFTAGLWLALEPVLGRLGYILPATSLRHTAQQAVLIGLASYLVWKHLIAGLLLLHLVTSYVYLGHSPFWNFIGSSGGSLLRPLSWLPLRLGRIDLSPLLGAALVLFLGELLDRSLPELYRGLPWR
jgi:uncharacterized protein YggT (Ycf19 family)